MKTKTLLFSAAALLAVYILNSQKKKSDSSIFFSILTRAQILEITRTMN